MFAAAWLLYCIVAALHGCLLHGCLPVDHPTLNVPQGYADRHRLSKTRACDYICACSRTASTLTRHAAAPPCIRRYPQTTCFYPAVIHEPPTPDRMNTYSMRFYDDDYPDGRARYQEVPVKFVVVKPKR